LAVAVAGEFLGPVARWDAEAVDGVGGVEDAELALGSALKVGPELSDVLTVPDLLGLGIRERLDHTKMPLVPDTFVRR